MGEFGMGLGSPTMGMGLPGLAIESVQCEHARDGNLSRGSASGSTDGCEWVRTATQLARRKMLKTSELLLTKMGMDGPPSSAPPSATPESP
jgi:hypothetical protein